MTLECKTKTLYMDTTELKHCEGCGKSNIYDIITDQGTELIPFKMVEGLDLCPECYQEETETRLADHAALIAELNQIVAEKDAALRAQESELSELYGEVVRLKVENDALAIVNAKNAVRWNHYDQNLHK